ncbi:hypothetical protein H2200_001201 [Cladophialophora chaetospira]|uniref:DUF7729 domain-containing protein n=1 Tax=Cladophialophora chaetospira TaxID=386627 RepID=A0AA39CPD0_9EURO|nr:hypothetical protein H2200_001201 [Cladophialophora chaetospira]
MLFTTTPASAQIMEFDPQIYEASAFYQDLAAKGEIHIDRREPPPRQEMYLERRQVGDSVVPTTMASTSSPLSSSSDSSTSIVTSSPSSTETITAPIETAPAISTATRAESLTPGVSTSTAASVTVVTTPIPTPFDTSIGSNFTSSTCPDFFSSFLGNSTFQSCVPVSLLLQNSNAFFRAQRSFTLLTQTLDAACNAPLAICSPLLGDLAAQLIDNKNCGQDYRQQNPLVMQAYAGLSAYEPVYRATCLRDEASKSYCFTEASTNSTNPADFYPYYTAIGLNMPQTANPTCSQCLKDTMQIFAGYAADAVQPLANTYLTCATQVDKTCGSNFVSTAVKVGSVASSNAATSVFRSSSLRLMLATVALAEAALAVLDKRHEGYFESSRGDDYIYIGGEINNHNVVIATLPAGQDYGVGSAAALASQVKARFHSLSFALLVGVAAGVPNLSSSDPGKLRDIRLGDVLVGVPTKEGSGIVHYDLGKDTEEGFLPTGRQAEPPALVRAAIGHIQLTQKRPFHAGDRLARCLSDLQFSTDDRSFLRPSPETDFLYATSSAAAPSSTPSLVMREPRSSSEPTRVWYGNIGSGNSLMRNARRRDELRDKYDLIGLEMEAAGVANILPVGVIRGVCDYGDAQKNKDWQPYAAGVAAVYAKGILHAINVQTVHPVQVQQEDLPPVAWLVPLITMTSLLVARLRWEHCKPCSWSRPGTRSLSLDWEASIADAKADVKVLLKEYLCSEKAGEWLLIVDNADDPDLWTTRKGPDETLVVALMDYIPSSSQGKTLITTRNHQVAVRVAKNNVVKLSELNGSDALSLTKSLLVHSDIMDEDDCASSTLLEHLAHLPLAIVQAAAYINENNVSRIKDYLRLWDSTEEAIVDLLSEDFEAENRYPELKNPIATTWLISFQHIRAVNPAAADMLAFLSCLDYKSIPQSLFPFRLFETERVNNQMMKATGVLTGYAFLHPHQAHQTEPVYDMHRLVHLATRNWLRREGSFASWSGEATQRIVEIFPDPYDHSHKKLRTLLMTHAEKILATPGLDDTEVSINLLAAMGHCYVEDGKYTNDVNARRAVVSWRSTIPDQHDVNLLVACRNLAVALSAAGEYTEAEGFAKRAVEGLIAISGKKDHDCLNAMYTLAEIYRRQGRYDESESLQSEVLKLRKKTSGEENVETLKSRESLANVYADKGLADKAEEHERVILEIRKKILGAQHPDTITSMHNLALTYTSQGRWEEAEVMQLDVLEAHKKHFGEDNPRTLRKLGSLAGTYAEQGRLTEAIDIEVSLLEKRSLVLGNDHPETLLSMFNLAMHLHQAKRRGEGMALMEDCLELQRRKMGDNHPDTMESMSGLALMWTKNGRNNDATTLLKECLELQKQNLGKDHLDTIWTMWDLAHVMRTTGLLDEAVALMEECLQIEKENTGEAHAETLFSMHFLASMLYEGTRQDEGVVLMKRCVELRTTTLGADDEETLRSKRLLRYWMTELEEEVATLKEEEKEGEPEEEEHKAHYEEYVKDEEVEIIANAKKHGSSQDAERVSDQIAFSHPAAGSENDRGRNTSFFTAPREHTIHVLPFRVGIRSTTSTPVRAIPGSLYQRRRQSTSSTDAIHGLERPYRSDQSCLDAEID